MTDEERQEMIANMSPEQRLRAVEIFLSVQEAIQDEKRFLSMTNAELANELVNGPWADLPMFSKWSNLLDAVVERLRAEPHRCEVCQKTIAARSNAEIIDRLRAENERLQERLSLIYGLTYDRDGLVTAASLGGLVDEVCQIAQGEYKLDPGTPPEQLRGEQ
jgi:hypothetical protein